MCPRDDHEAISADCKVCTLHYDITTGRGMIMKPVLVFDFDGVIANSIFDSFITAYNTYIRFESGHTLPTRSEIDARNAYAFTDSHPELFVPFRRLIPLANRAEDYYIIMKALDIRETDRIQTEADLTAAKNRLPRSLLDGYYQTFYETRWSLQESSPEKWLMLVPPFPGMLEALVSLEDRFVLAIATAKDLKSVTLHLDHYGLSRFFKVENILDKDFADSKRTHLTHLHKKFGIPFSRIHFIDDKVMHLCAVKDLGLHLYLSLWGFNTEREHDIARKEGFTLLRLEDLPNLKS